jgi:transposase
MKAMASVRSYSVDFKRPVAQEYIAGETLHGFARRHNLSPNLIRFWVAKYEDGAFDDDTHAADFLQEYEAKIAALERMVGRPSSPAPRSLRRSGTAPAVRRHHRRRSREPDQP